MNDDTTDLLDLVDDLTKPTKRHERQDILKDGHVIGSQKVTIEHAPLLEQLAEAVAGAVGAGSSKGSLAFERNPLDADALYKFVKIDETIRQWCAALKLAATRYPAENLRAWYVASRARNWDENVEGFYARMLGKWVREITAKLDPHRERELPDDCPLCGAHTWWRDGVEYNRPLVVRYKEIGPDLVQEARGLCRACANVWRVRELAWELELKHRADAEHDLERAS